MSGRSRLARMARMPARELATRARMAAARRARHLAWSVRVPEWQRTSLEIKAANLVHRDAGARLAARDWRGAHHALSAHFATRVPRFPLVPASRWQLARLIRDRFPDATRDAAVRAERALSGRFDVLGYPDVSFAAADGAPGIDWHRDPVHERSAPRIHWSRVPYLSPEVGDHKIIWELNRHQHWLALGRAYWLTGDRRFRTGCIRQLADWLAQNPPETGINWASMLELSLRCLSWLWALHFFVEQPLAQRSAEDDETPWTVDLLAGLQAQLDLVEWNLSTYFSPNTHLLGEALALYVAGRSLPELRRAAAWADTGRTILLDQIDHQIERDGGHAERSFHYHRYALDFYLLALSVARITGDAAAEARLHDACLRLARFARAVAGADDRLPLVGDDDGGQLFPICAGEVADAGPSLGTAAVLLGDPDLRGRRAHEEVLWLCGTGVRDVPLARDTRASEALTASGYCVSRTERGDRLVMDVGPLGYLNGGHAHADALSMVLDVAGSPLLIDPGTACYSVDPVQRDRFRSTAYHNTVVVDGRSQSVPAGPFSWVSSARGALDAWRIRPGFDYIEASHDGYGAGGHQRQVLARPGCWIVVDWIGPGHRHCAAHWHLDPAWSVEEADDGRVGVRHVTTGRRAWLVAPAGGLETFHGEQEEPALGWCSPVYGRVVATTTLRIRGAPPCALVTMVTDAEGEPRAESLTLSRADGASPDGVAFAWYASGLAETVIVQKPGAKPGRRLAGGIATEAACLVLRESVDTGISRAWWVPSAGDEDADGVSRDSSAAPPAHPARSGIVRPDRPFSLEAR